MTTSDTQVLITGCYRSGTEYITQLLNNSPDLVATMYVTNFMRFCYERYDPVSDADNYTDLVFDTGKRMRKRWGRRLNIHEIVDECNERETVDYGFLYDRMMSDVCLTDDVSMWAEKTQLVWTDIPDFLEMFENGKTILIVRDPRSVLASFKRFTYAPEPAYLGAIFNALGAMQHGHAYRSNLPSDQFHIIKYEDIVRNPEETLTEALDYLGASSEHDPLSEAGWTDPSGEPWHANSSYDDSKDSEFDAEAAVHRWKGNLEDWELSLCERVTEEMMGEYGYERSGTTVPEREYKEIIESDEQINRFYTRWQTTGDGVEEYPTDPLDPDNWEENAAE